MFHHQMASCCLEKPARWSQPTVLRLESCSWSLTRPPPVLLSWRTTSNCSEVLLVFSGNRILTLGEVPKDQVYSVKLKGVSVCFAMLKAVLSGNYVNFGVFRLYGDDALDNALQTFIKLLLSIPHSDLLVRSSTPLFEQTECVVSVLFNLLILNYNLMNKKS